jgi:hypothetical protein
MTSDRTHVERYKNKTPFHDNRLGVVSVLIDADAKSRKPREEEPTREEVIDWLKEHRSFLIVFQFSLTLKPPDWSEKVSTKSKASLARCACARKGSQPKTSDAS